MTGAIEIDRASLTRFLGRLSAAAEQGREQAEHDGWRADRLPGGRNNLSYRLTGPSAHLVAKFTVRDARDRAGREFNGLTALASAGIAIAPRPVLLERDAYFQPLVVQEWLEGETLRQPPDTDADWAALVELLAACHSLHPGQEAAPLRPAVLNAHTADEALQIVRVELARLPDGERPPEVERLAERLERTKFDDWPAPPLTFVRCDPNVTNFLRRRGTWRSVDWEYAGWGDPAWEVADLMRHPSWRDVPADRWAWFCHAALRGNAHALYRVGVYAQVITVWWLARLARLRYETPRGLDPRLAAPSPGWEIELEQNYKCYLHLGRACRG